MEDTGFYFKQTCPKIQKGIDEAVELLRKSMKLGEEILPNLKFKEQPDNRRDVRTAIIISLFRELLERIDGILILLEKHSTLNASIILRSYIEISFDLRIILKNQGKKMALYYMLDKRADTLEKDMVAGIDITVGIQDIIEFIATNTELVEIQNLSIVSPKDILNKIGNKKWCKLGYSYTEYRAPEDKLFYKYLCKETHGENSLGDNFYREDRFELRALRFPINYEVIVSLVTDYMLKIVTLLKDEFELDEIYSNRAYNIFELAKTILYDLEKRVIRE
ncbi:DUF5677 domain-containing protein [Cetobacterium somerae]|uniref:DUF5677 domain-containing protein n=1 Tax=Cetobacterium somerae TaxID=188913 RepID=UPI00248EBDEE|nr:DUF5677 domain-containing protein [Cetobacterium somerae]